MDPIKPSALRIVFMGTPDFAVPSLRLLHEQGYQIAGVVTATDKLGGRGKNQVIASPVKIYAQEHHLPVLQPKSLKSPKFLRELETLKPDIQIVVAFRMLPESVWNLPPLGTFNLHGSLLPRYRGAAPIHWAVIHGERETGLTSFKLQHEIDTGSILLQRKVPIGVEDTTGTLYNRMKTVGAEVVLDTVQTICRGKYHLYPQDDRTASQAPKLFTQDAEIDFNRPAKDVYNFIRGMSPVPGAWTTIDGKVVKIYFAEPVSLDSNLLPGQIRTDQRNFLEIATRGGAVRVKTIQMEGKRVMDIRTFLNGYAVKDLVTEPSLNEPS